MISAGVFPLESIYVISVSGGKDSAATALHMRDLGVERRHVFADTGWEAPETYEYIAGPLTDAIGPIDVVRSSVGGMADWVRKKRMFPSRLRRWCTTELKVKPIFRYIFDLARSTGRPIVNVVGLRADESEQRAKLEPFDGFTDKRGSFYIWRPILNWSEADVIQAHKRAGLQPNPLYLAGADRVGCYPCIYSRKTEIRSIAERAPDRIDLIRSLETSVTEQRGRTRSFFSGQGPADLGGKSAYMPIDRVVEWSKTGNGGRQFEFFGRHGADAGCVRWGMCERAK